LDVCGKFLNFAELSINFLAIVKKILKNDSHAQKVTLLFLFSQ
jgi:hypothetical protein